MIDQLPTLDRRRPKLSLAHADDLLVLAEISAGMEQHRVGVAAQHVEQRSTGDMREVVRARMALEGGQAVIVDAVHAKTHERDAVAALAAERNIPFTGLWLHAPGRLMRERVAARTGDVSDATAEVVEVQLGYDIGPQSFAAIDASKPLDQVAAACLERIGAGASAR